MSELLSAISPSIAGSSPCRPEAASDIQAVNLFARLMYHFLTALLFRKRLNTLDESSVSVGVFWTDRTYGGRLKRTRLASYADIAIFDFMVRTPVFGVVRKKGWLPIIAARRTRLLNAAKPGGRLTIHTRLIGWDEHHSIFRHSYFDGETQVAEGISVGRMIKRGFRGGLSRELLDAVGLNEMPIDNVPADLAPMVSELMQDLLRQRTPA